MFRLGCKLNCKMSSSKQLFLRPLFLYKCHNGSVCFRIHLSLGDLVLASLFTVLAQPTFSKQ